ncbi:MAG: type VI secretion system tube protein Hcp [Bryobacterales bacterium]|nr:type VI secretion system tube protein Hcp [Bryobacterales bacterium]
MKFPGIAGRGKGAYTGWIELDGVSLGSQQYGASANTERGMLPLEISVFKKMDGASPLLMETQLRSTIVGDVILELTRAERGKDYAVVRIELSGARIEYRAGSGMDEAWDIGYAKAKSIGPLQLALRAAVGSVAAAVVGRPAR